MYEDKALKCKDCGEEFVFTAGEQEFYAEKGFQNEPQRCKKCRDARKNAGKPAREYYTTVCACFRFSPRTFCRSPRVFCRCGQINSAKADSFLKNTVYKPKNI